VDELRWPTAVRPDDQVRLTAEAIEIRRSERRPDRGTVRMRLTAHNQDGEVVFSAIPTILVPARPA
jgi:acyl dehydratase